MARTIQGSASGVIHLTENNRTTPIQQISFSPITGDTDADVSGTRVLDGGSPSQVTLWDIDNNSGDGVNTVAHLIYLKAISSVTKAARSVTVTLRNDAATTDEFVMEVTELIYFCKENANIESIKVLAQSGDDTEISYTILGT